MPSLGSVSGGTGATVDPNPALLFNVYGGMLMTAAGLFYRLLARDSAHHSGVGAARGLTELLALFDQAQGLQNDHSELIFQSSAENKALYPIGEHTAWTADLFRYRKIRDESIHVFVRIARETLRIRPYSLRAAVADQIAWDLQAVQRSLVSYSKAGAFREAAFALSGGFDAATSSLRILANTDQDELDETHMPFA
jgi:hypothetical protein